jgi:hypothetical protein
VNIQFDAEPKSLSQIQDFLIKDDDVHLQYFQKK